VRRFIFSSNDKRDSSPNKPRTESVLTLSDAEVGREYTLVEFDGGPRLREKIYSMGLNSGAVLRVLINSGSGPVELEVRQTRLGIGRGMAAKIRIKELES